MSEVSLIMKIRMITKVMINMRARFIMKVWLVIKRLGQDGRSKQQEWHILSQLRLRIIDIQTGTSRKPGFSPVLFYQCRGSVRPIHNDDPPLDVGPVWIYYVYWDRTITFDGRQLFSGWMCSCSNITAPGGIQTRDPRNGELPSSVYSACWPDASWRVRYTSWRLCVCYYTLVGTTVRVLIRLQSVFYLLLHCNASRRLDINNECAIGPYLFFIHIVRTCFVCVCREECKYTSIYCYSQNKSKFIWHVFACN